MSVVLGSSREIPVGHTVGLQGGHGGFGAASEMTRVSTTATEKERMGAAPASCFLEVVHKEKCTPSLFIELGSASNSSELVNVCTRTCGREEEEAEEEEEEEEEADEDDDQDGEIDDDEDVRVKFKGALSSMGALEESLPIKRGLSNFFNGKSKSFANLSEVTAVKDLAKPEIPFNKRRRTLIARSWRPRRPFHTTSLTSFASVPAFSSTEEEGGAGGKEEIGSLGAREILRERF